jgi:CRISPR-associated endonuclease/helicase Cas3
MKNLNTKLISGNFCTKEGLPMPAQFPAHIRLRQEEREVQTVQTHCKNTAAIAGRALAGIGLQKSAYLAGILHDAGKFTQDFAEYLEKAVSGHALPRGSVNHTFAGVRYLLKNYHTPKDEYDLSPMVAELLAYAVGAHHGLFDCVDENGNSGFQHRLDKADVPYREAMENYLTQCASRAELDQLFAEAVQELSPVLFSFCDLAQQNDAYDGEVSFYLGLLARLLLSAVVEGDRQDTAGFMNDAVPPEWPDDRRELWKNCLTRVEQKLAAFPTDTPIAQARQAISRQCRAAAEQPGGVFRLNVPTGGGKTLSSLRFALAHAARWNKRRIIFTSPLLAILDQNAQVLRDYIGDDGIILEHHSNVVRGESAGAIVDGADPELLTENWGAPVIITTLVQLLNTMFAGKTACIRRFHGLVHSIIVIDEVQTVPTRMLTLFNLAVDFLAQVCGATVVLCSATQPCLEQTAHPISVPIRDIVPYDETLWKPFRRTAILDAGPRRLEEIPAFALEQLASADSLLVVCNKKDEASYLYQQLSQSEASCFHLSAAMCMAHRKQTLADMAAALDPQNPDRPEKLICVATQVIEAGVDISFDCVIRLTAGLDNIIQAAGRCNRNGERPAPAPVYAVQCADEKLGKLQDIQQAKDATLSLLGQFQNRPDDFQNDLASDQAVRYYYQRLYREQSGNYQDYKLKDQPTLYELLSQNADFADGETGFALNQAFKQAGGQFQVFDDESEDVIVPYGEGAECIADLCSEAALHDAQFLQRCLERAKPYTVSVFGYQKKQLLAQGGLYTGCRDKVLILQAKYYDAAMGLVTDGAQNDYLEA